MADSPQSQLASVCWWVCAGLNLAAQVQGATPPHVIKAYSKHNARPLRAQRMLKTRQQVSAIQNEDVRALRVMTPICSQTLKPTRANGRRQNEEVSGRKSICFEERGCFGQGFLNLLTNWGAL